MGITPSTCSWKPWLGIALLSLNGFASIHAQENSSLNNSNEPTTTVYKVVNPDGSVSFSDQPESRSEALQIAPVPTVPALKPSQINGAWQQTQTPEQPASSYQAFSITAPADQSAFNSGSGDVTVVLEVSPGLVSGHQIELRLDNKLIQRGSQTLFTIPAVDRGTHSLEARIVSSSGETLKATNSSFTLHRPSIKR